MVKYFLFNCSFELKRLSMTHTSAILITALMQNLSNYLSPALSKDVRAYLMQNPFSHSGPISSIC